MITTTKRFPTNEEHTSRMISLEAQMLAVEDEMTEDKDDIQSALLGAELDDLHMTWSYEFPEFLPCLMTILPVKKETHAKEPATV